MHVMVPKEAMKWHEKLSIWFKSNINEVVQYVWPLLVLFMKERMQQWIGGLADHFQPPNQELELQRRGML